MIYYKNIKEKEMRRLLIFLSCYLILGNYEQRGTVLDTVTL